MSAAMRGNVKVRDQVVQQRPSMKHSVAVLDDYQGVARQYGDFARLKTAGIEVNVFRDHLTSEADLVQRLQPFTIVSAMRERTPFRRSLLERLPNLKLLVTTGPVNASIDGEACKELGIAFSGTASRNPVFLRSSTCEVCAHSMPPSDFKSRPDLLGIDPGLREESYTGIRERADWKVANNGRPRLDGCYFGPIRTWRVRWGLCVNVADI